MEDINQRGPGGRIRAGTCGGLNAQGDGKIAERKLVKGADVPAKRGEELGAMGGKKKK